MNIFNKRKRRGTVGQNSTSKIDNLKSSLLWVKLQN